MLPSVGHRDELSADEQFLAASGRDFSRIQVVAPLFARGLGVRQLAPNDIWE